MKPNDFLVDTHTHLYSEQFDEDRTKVIQNAINNNVTRFCIPAIDASYASKMYELEQQFPEHIFLMTGLHPTHVKENYKDELTFVENELKRRKFYAVGEIGIDLYWDKTFLKQQQQAFLHQIQLAKKYRLPINIHCRDAFNEVFEILEQEKDDALYGIFHCFTGTEEQAEKAINYNMKLGIGGVATFKNGKINQFLRNISLEHIVLETDAPYLAPTPYRGKRNESAYTLLVAEKLSEIYQVPLSTIVKTTTENANTIFNF